MVLILRLAYVKKESYFYMSFLPCSPSTTKYYHESHSRYVSGYVKKKLAWNYFVCGGLKFCVVVTNSSFFFLVEALGEWNKQQNSANLTHMELDRCWIVEYSRLSYSTYTGTTNQRSHVNYYFNMEKVCRVFKRIWLNWFLDK